MSLLYIISEDVANVTKQKNTPPRWNDYVDRICSFFKTNLPKPSEFNKIVRLNDSSTKIVCTSIYQVMKNNCSNFATKNND